MFRVFDNKYHISVLETEFLSSLLLGNNGLVKIDGVNLKRQGLTDGFILDFHIMFVRCLSCILWLLTLDAPMYEKSKIKKNTRKYLQFYRLIFQVLLQGGVQKVP